VEPWCAACCTVRAEKVIVSEGEIDYIVHLPLDHEEECMDEGDIIGM
jgi:hypothetical protein